MSDLALGLTVEGVAEAVADLNKIKQAEENVGKSAEESNKKVDTSAFNAGKALKSAASEGERFSNSINQVAGRVQGAAGAFAGLANAIGGSGAGQGLSLVSSMAGAIAQGAQLGTQFGPQGALVGAVVGAAIPAFTSMVQWLDRTEQAAIDLANANLRTAQSYSTILSRMREVDQQRRQEQTLAMGLGSRMEQEANLEAQQSEANAIQDRLDQINEQLSSGVGTRESQTLTAAYDVLTRELARANGEVAVAQEALALVAGDEEAGAEDLMASLVADARPERRGAGGVNPVTDREREWQDDLAVARANEERAAAERERQLNALLSRDSGAGRADGGMDGTQLDLGTWLDGVSETGSLDIISGLPEEAEEFARAAEEAAKAQRELNQAATEATAAFSDGYTNSIDDAIEKWRDANEAIRRAGGTIISTGRLMERSMIAVGNNIAETIGGTMKGAFEEALGAWLDGSKSFVQAAEDMAKGIIKALTIESIVQAVVEVARAVASFASMNIPEGIAHLGAAAAWGAVGVVAGSVGAAVGAFGGGGGGGAAQQAGGGADNRDLSRGAVSERENNQPITVYVYPQVFAESRAAQKFTYDSLNAGARNGRSIDSRATRSHGR